MKWKYNDGGRRKYFKGGAQDCVCRSIAIATGRDYMEIYRLINETAKLAKVKKGKARSSARSGVYAPTFRRVLAGLGWEWHPTMFPGKGCVMHMRKSELPSGTVIVRLSRHLACVKGGVLHDTYDCSRGGKRCVYGYWSAAK